MIEYSQNERNEMANKFYDPDLSLKEATLIAKFLGLKYNLEEITDSPNKDNLYKSAKIWERVGNSLSFNILDKVTLDSIENELGAKVGLQVYRFYVEKRRKDNLQETDLITQNKLVCKMQSVNCNKDFIDHLLKLT